jgi:hypothetical protein
MTAMMHELARITGKDFNDVIKAEGVSALEGMITRTDAASKELIERTKNPEVRAAKLAAIGLAKKVYAQVADKWGLQVTKIPQYALAATTRSGDHPDDAQGREVVKGGEYSLHGEVSRLYWPGMFRAIAGGINGRVGYFRTNLRKGVFDKFEEIATKYKGLHVNRNA